jgi:hypothetical protein
MRVSFRQNLLPEEGGICREEETLFRRADRGVLKQAEVGVPVAVLIRQLGITEQTLYRWKKQYKAVSV